jgi:hypothetical protein
MAFEWHVPNSGARPGQVLLAMSVKPLACPHSFSRGR